MNYFKTLKIMVISIFLPLLIYTVWNWFPLFEHADLAWRDFLYTVSPSDSDNDDVIIVAIDEPSFQQIKIRWPWPRSLHAKIIENLNKAGASSIVFDIIFPEASPDPLEDKKFADALKQADNVVIGANLTKTQRHGYEQIFVEDPIPVLKEAAAEVGMVNLIPDIDGTVRQGIHKIYNRPTITMAAIETAGNIIYKKDTEQNSTGIHDRFHIDFSGNSGTLSKVSYYQVLNNMAAPDLFKNKIVLIGLHVDSAVEVQSGADAYPTPFLRFTKKMMFGVEIHGNIIRTIINRYPVTVFSNPVQWIFFLSFAMTLFFVRKQPVLLTLGIFFQIIILGGISVIMFNTSRTFLDILPAVAGIAVNGLFLGVNEFQGSYMEKLKLRKAFSSYVSPDVVNNIIKNYDSLKLGGEKKELSVLFSDIRNFTNLSENMLPEELVLFLNTYFKEMTNIVYNHKGTLDKYIGDAVMVIFGAPVSMKNHADQACRAALKMIHCIKQMNLDQILGKENKLKIGIGITTGEMIVGNLGSSLRFDYTVIGDNVNLASRLEGVTKIYNVSIIINEDTKQALNEFFFCRELDLIRVKGKKKAIKIYELISEETISDNQKKINTLFARGLEAYRAREWDKSIIYFKKVLEYDPHDGPSNTFLDRYYQNFSKNPPNENWDGVWEMETK